MYVGRNLITYLMFCGAKRFTFSFICCGDAGAFPVYVGQIQDIHDALTILFLNA